MLTLKRHTQPAPMQAPSRTRYRLRRFLMSRSWWALTRVLLPVVLILVIGLQLFRSDALRVSITNMRTSVVETVAFLPGLKIEELVIENATKLQEGQVLEALGVTTPSSILLIDREALKSNISNFDEIGESAFRFGFNGKLYVELKPRVPTMIYYDGQSFSSIDNGGHLVEVLHARSARANLFVISGEGALDASEEAARIIAALKPYSEKIRGLVRVGARRWDVVLTNDARLMLPAQAPLHALSIMLVEHQKSDILNRDIEAYDMRNPARPVLRLGAAALESIKPAAEVETQ